MFPASELVPTTLSPLQVPQLHQMLVLNNLSSLLLVSLAFRRLRLLVPFSLAFRRLCLLVLFSVTFRRLRSLRRLRLRYIGLAASF